MEVEFSTEQRDSTIKKNTGRMRLIGILCDNEGVETAISRDDGRKRDSLDRKRYFLGRKRYSLAEKRLRVFSPPNFTGFLCYSLVKKKKKS